MLDNSHSMDVFWCCSGAWQKSPNCGMEKEIQPWGRGWPAVLKGYDDGDGFSYCGTARNPSLGHPSPLDGTGMLHAGSTTHPPGAGVLSPPHNPQKCSEVGLFFIPMTRGMAAAAQGGEWQHQMWFTPVNQLSPKIPYLPFMWHPEKGLCGLKLPKDGLCCPPSPARRKERLAAETPPLVPIA